MSLETFRIEAARWLDENCPQELRGSGASLWGGGSQFPLEDTVKRHYFDAMYERGWTAPTWLVMGR